MKKIAIFGDSIADDKINWENQNKWLDVGPSWVDHLRKHYDIDNYSLGGSSLYFSKMLFDQANLDFYDKVIFITTANNRRYQVIPGVDPNSQTLKNWNWTMALNTMEYYELKPEIKAYLSALVEYFVLLHNDSDIYFHELMKQDIRRIRPDALMIDYYEYTKIMELEQNYWREKGYEIHFDKDARRCHLCEENNFIFSEIVKSLIDSNAPSYVPDLKDFILPTKEFEYYFR